MQENDNKTHRQRLKYTTPRLIQYGSLRELTKGGSSGWTESGNPMGKGQSNKERS